MANPRRLRERPAKSATKDAPDGAPPDEQTKAGKPARAARTGHPMEGTPKGPRRGQ